MKENKEAFLLAGGDALVHLAESLRTKNIPQHFFGPIHLVRTYLVINFSTSLPHYVSVHILDDPPSFL